MAHHPRGGASACACGGAWGCCRAGTREAGPRPVPRPPRPAAAGGAPLHPAAARGGGTWWCRGALRSAPPATGGHAACGEACAPASSAAGAVGNGDSGSDAAQNTPEARSASASSFSSSIRRAAAVLQRQSVRYTAVAAVEQTCGRLPRGHRCLLRCRRQPAAGATRAARRSPCSRARPREATRHPHPPPGTGHAAPPPRSSHHKSFDVTYFTRKKVNGKNALTCTETA